MPPLDKLKRELKVEHMEGSIESSPALAKLHEDIADEMEALEKEYMSHDFYKRTSTLVENTYAKTLLY